MSNSQSIDVITNNLILKYKDRGNKLYEQKKLINTSIMNKDEIILKENEEIKLKDIRINTLKYIVIMSIFICAFIILYAMNIFTTAILIMGVLGLIIIFAIFIYFTNHRINLLDKAKDKIKNINVDMPFINNIIDKIENKFKCPSKCTKKSKDNNNNLYNTFGLGDGDNDYIPDDLVYYKCNWIGSNNYSGIGQDNVVYSSKPCEYKQNFTQVGKYICLADPNDPKTNFSKSCTDVTYY